MIDIDAPQTAVTELRSIKEIIQDLTKPIAFKHLGKRKQGGKDIYYISWDDAVQYFNYIIPNWNYEITNITTAGGKLILVARISIQTSNGLYYREATGQEDEDLDAYGDSSSNAEAQALKRAMSKFGFGLYLYNEDNRFHPNNPNFNRNYETVFTSKNTETAQSKDEGVKTAQTASNASKKAIEPVKEQQVRTPESAKVPPKEKRAKLTDGQLSSLIAMTTKYEAKGITEKDIALEVSQGEFERYDDLDLSDAGDAIKLIQIKIKQG